MTASAPHNINAALRVIDTEIARMAALVESQLSGAITAFERRDVTAAERIIIGDIRVDALYSDIDAGVIEFLGAAPMPPQTLRDAITLMKLAGELERIGDLAKNIAKRTLVVSREKFARPTPGVARMGRASLRQFSDILNAYNTRNLTAAKAVWGGDDELDELYNSVFRDILLAMMENSDQVNACTHLVFIAKNFERVGDHATNIAEAIHFMVTGVPIGQPRPKGDETATTIISPDARASAKQ